jgi:hypothetical protein
VHRERSPDLGRPRTVAEIFATALALYARYPLLVIGLAAAIVIPYSVVVLLVINASPLGQRSVSAGTALILELVLAEFVAPLIAALQVRALLMIADHEQPRFGEVLARSLRSLPVVVAAQIVASIGIALGLFLLIVPGIYLWCRWAVVAQAAAVERTNWPGALQRSGALAARNYLRILGILLCLLLANLTLSNVGASIIGSHTGAGEVIGGIALLILELSFNSLTVAVLYFDLRARERLG